MRLAYVHIFLINQMVAMKDTGFAKKHYIPSRTRAPSVYRLPDHSELVYTTKDRNLHCLGMRWVTKDVVYMWRSKRLIALM